ncbi:response regulator [Oceanispirochaeta sp.]|jgi:DNA-binding response OmpR family regulator|uniref:response regulator n=1 Tax=Oceanispirochaeta sp. TaxID=2035350 RepID=UPI0026291939|nr:response regulator [Oceanispirochaeta sp.]MDA3958048.1 response regulator [Oceanispirochaeta sp.]
MAVKTILIVEDEPIIGMELKESLEKLGYNVPEVIRNADGVMSGVIKNNPDLIIMDIYLKSFIDGIDAAQRVKMMKDTPIIFLTAYPNDSIRKKAMTIKPAAYLLKPIRGEELQMKIKEVLG